MKRIYTSYYANLKNLPPSMARVRISIGSPRWMPAGTITHTELRLAPTRDMLKLTAAEYDEKFAAILAKLDPQEIYNSLPDECALLCFEKPNECCHRRWVAEWLEEGLGIEVCEWGFPRHTTLRYKELPSTLAADKTAPKKSPPPPKKRGGLLF